jgi:hypothetical protein
MVLRDEGRKRQLMSSINCANQGQNHRARCGRQAAPSCIDALQIGVMQCHGETVGALRMQRICSAIPLAQVTIASCVIASVKFADWFNSCRPDFFEK